MKTLDSHSYPPRGMRRETAAWYVGVGTTKFDEMVSDGRMPKPKRVDGIVVWDRLRLRPRSPIFRRTKSQTLSTECLTRLSHGAYENKRNEWTRKVAAGPRSRSTRHQDRAVELEFHVRH